MTLILTLVVILIFGNTVNTLQETFPCPVALAIDLTNGQKHGSVIIKDNMQFMKADYFFFNNSLLGCACNIRTCIRKCCNGNQMMINHECQNSSNHGIQFKVFDGLKNSAKIKQDSFYFIYNKECKSGMFRLDPDEEFYIQETGHLRLAGEHFKPEEFCIETFDDKEMENKMSVLVCLFEENDKAKENNFFLVIGMIISMPFLLVTFIVYALLPERNLHMKALMFYVLSLMFAYLFLVIVQLTESRFPDEVCYSIGYFCLVFFLVSFFWMNVICIDIWLAFSGLRGFSGSKKIAERRRFYIYCVYAIGMPILHAVIVILIQKFSKPSSWFNPGIGEGQCFLRRGFPELLYFYGPMGVLITINIIFFAITAIRIRTVKKDTSVLKREDSKRHSYENDKQNFNLYLKLLFAMGVNWSMEIISWAVIWAGIAPDAVWYLTDFCNAIYGVFIFFIFVFKRNIWKLLKKRFYSFTGKAHLAHSMASTNTRVTSYSTNNTSENPTGAEGIMLSTHIN